MKIASEPHNFATTQHYAFAVEVTDPTTNKTDQVLGTLSATYYSNMDHLDEEIQRTNRDVLNLTEAQEKKLNEIESNPRLIYDRSEVLLLDKNI